MRPIVHAITPGDHFSPRTGSALPTVIHGLATGAKQLADSTVQSVLVAAGTYPDRYDSMGVIEYSPRPNLRRVHKVADLTTGRAVGIRPLQRRTLAAMLVDQRMWAPSFILAHNLVQLARVMDLTRHKPVLYAHNDLLRTYGSRESARALAGTELIVCVSQFLASRTVPQLPPGLRERVVTVPNAADAAQFSAGPRQPEPDRLKVAFVGRIVPEKGVDVLVRAMTRLADPRIELTVIGSAGFDGTAPLTAYERQLRRLACSIPGSTRFLPFTDRASLPDLLRAQDVLVVPSRWPEPWGLTVSEGQASGLVVLASDVGGIPEAISDPSHLVPVGDRDALASQLERFVDDYELLVRHQAQARSHAVANDWCHSWRILARHLGGIA